MAASRWAFFGVPETFPRQEVHLWRGSLTIRSAGYPDRSSQGTPRGDGPLRLMPSKVKKRTRSHPTRVGFQKSS